MLRILEWVADIADGLGYAHRAGIVHRDVKPANVMLDSEGSIKILDFGIARVADSGTTQKGLLIGTLNYMSPEQLSGAPVDGRSDMFALGAVLYELLCRRQAFPGNLDSGVLGRIMYQQPEAVEQLCPGHRSSRRAHRPDGAAEGAVEPVSGSCRDAPRASTRAPAPQCARRAAGDRGAR